MVLVNLQHSIHNQQTSLVDTNELQRSLLRDLSVDECQCVI